MEFRCSIPLVGQRRCGFRVAARAPAKRVAPGVHRKLPAGDIVSVPAGPVVNMPADAS